MTQRLRLARRTRVDAAVGRLAIEPLLIRDDADLLAAMRYASAHPSTGVIGVTDADGRLIGIAPVSVLAEAVVAHAVPEAFFTDVGAAGDVGRFAHVLEATVLGDIALPPATITGDRSISDAFRLMHSRKLSGLYVVDADDRPTGYLDLQELAMAYVEALEEERGAPATRVEHVRDAPRAPDA
ncbi:MAG TPA: CBS domain-containing protein [Candidatus Limnocylindrales bacterium]|nr:CBS domain-containing protein [Candidatus Limnocylindrales bacterium]